MKNWLYHVFSFCIIFASLSLSAQSYSCAKTAKVTYEELNLFAGKLNQAIQTGSPKAHTMRFEFAMKLSDLYHRLINRNLAFGEASGIKNDVYNDLQLYTAEHFETYYSDGKFSIYFLEKELLRLLWRKYRSYKIPVKVPNNEVVDEVCIAAPKIKASSNPDVLIRKLAKKKKTTERLVRNLLYWEGARDFKRDQSVEDVRKIEDMQDFAIAKSEAREEAWHILEKNEFELRLFDFLNEHTKTNLLERFYIVSVLRLQLGEVKKIEDYILEQGYPFSKNIKDKIIRFLKEFGRYLEGDLKLHNLSLFNKPLFVESKRQEWGFAEALLNNDLSLPFIAGLDMPVTYFTLEKYLGKSANDQLLTKVAQMTGEEIVNYFEPKNKISNNELVKKESSKDSKEQGKEEKVTSDWALESPVEKIRRVQYVSLEPINNDKTLVEFYLLLLSHGDLRDSEVLLSVLILGDYIYQNPKIDMPLRRTYARSRPKYLKLFKQEFGFSYKSLELKVSGNNRQVFKTYKAELKQSLSERALSKNLLFQWYLSGF